MMDWSSWARRFATGAMVLAGVTAATCAGATEGGGTAYPLGVSTINPGLEPSPPGFTFLNYNTYYSASHFRNSRGNDALPGFHVSLALSSLRLDYTLPEGVMPPGWHIGVQLVQPVFNNNLYTRPGRTGRTLTVFGLADTTVVPLVIGYIGQSETFGRWATKFKLPISVPTGDYQMAVPLNKGRNYVALEPQFGIQAFPRPNITYGATFNYIYNFNNPANNYLSGQEFILEPVAEYSPVQNLWVGAQGYVYRQITTDKLHGAQFRDGNFGSALAVGPQVRYSIRGISATAKWQHEFGVRDRADGERFWLQIFVPL